MSKMQPTKRSLKKKKKNPKNTVSTDVFLKNEFFKTEIFIHFETMWYFQRLTVTTQDKIQDFTKKSLNE